MKKIPLFSRLFARPSFVEGISRILDMGNTLEQYNTSQIEEEADLEALKSDGKAVGNDMRSSINTYEQQRITKTA